MVVRIYRGVTKPDRLKDYEKFLAETAIPLAQGSKGCIDAKALKSLGVTREVLFITTWESLEDVKEFAGANWQAPHFVGEEADMLDGVPDVKHYHQISDYRKT